MMMADSGNSEIVGTGIKGFNRNLTCLDHQFEPGKTYTVDGEIIACENGFHCIPDDENPLFVFGYYAPATSRYFSVTYGGETQKNGDKVASASITVGVEISLGDLIQRAVEFVISRTKRSKANTNSGYYGAASNSGNCGAASNSGNCGAASNSGTRGAASNSGYYGAASNSGYYGAASNSGTRGAAMSHAYGSKVMCEGDGQALYCSEFNDKIELVSNACGITGQNGIKAGVWYVCRNGKLVEA